MTLALATKGMIAPTAGDINITNIDCPEIAVAFDEDIEITVEIQGDFVI